MSQQEVQDATPEWEVVDNPESPAGESGKVAKYSPIEEGLAKARQKYENIAFDLTTTKGNNEARTARKELVTLRTTLERTRKEQKAPALAYIEKLDGEAARIKKAIVALEDPIDEQIKADETRREQEKAERERLERERLAEIRGRISAITGAVLSVATGSTGQIMAKIEELGALSFSEELYGDFAQDAISACSRTLEELRALHERVLAREEETARLEQQRQELARQQAEFERQRAEQQAELERQQREAAERLRREQEELEAKRQEQLRIEAAERDERERQAQVEREQAEHRAAELKRQEDAFEEERRIARESLAAERAEIERKRAAVEAPPPAQPPAEQPPSAQPPADDLFSTQMPDDESTMPGDDTAIDIMASSPGAAASVADLIGDALDAAACGRPSDAELVEAVMCQFDVEADVVIGWLESFNADFARAEMGEVSA